MKEKGENILMFLTYTFAIFTGLIPLAGLVHWIYANWENALTIIGIALCLVLSLILIYFIAWIKGKVSDYKKFKQGEFPPVYIDINRIDKCFLPDPRFRISLEERYESAFSYGIRVSRKYLSDLTVKGDMPMKCMEEILKMKNLSRLDLSRVRFMSMPDKDLLAQIFCKLEKLEVLMPPPSEYWVENYK